MDSLLAPSCATLEFMVMVFQMTGVISLCLTRLCPGTPWVHRGRVGFVVSLIGLGVFGAICGRFDSHFALLAGGTMTVLLLGMITGAGSLDVIASDGHRGGSDRAVAA